MTQHTETATPKRYDWFTEDFGGDSVMRQAVDGRYVLHEDYAALQAKLTTASLELTAERDAVAQYIGERNELREKLEALELVLHKPTQDQIAHVLLNAAAQREETLRTQLAQAQNEALERAAEHAYAYLVDQGLQFYGCDNHATRLHNEIVALGESPSSAKGEPG